MRKSNRFNTPIELVLATGNTNKLLEIKAVLPKWISVVDMRTAGYDQEIAETADTLEGNARLKALTVYDALGKNCMADDTGLVVEALGGAPGVYSARYAGPGCSDQDNVKKLLKAMEGCSNRAAKFRTVIHLIWSGNEHRFVGEVDGEIGLEPRGENGFGYDPVFIPKGGNKTFAELSLQEKNAISHRAKAVQKLATFFESF
ncbi:MAG: non-canonical purine NTP diphosphatase [Salibacteraceae bacterium]